MIVIDSVESHSLMISETLSSGELSPVVLPDASRRQPLGIRGAVLELFSAHNTQSPKRVRAKARSMVFQALEFDDNE